MTANTPDNSPSIATLDAPQAVPVHHMYDTWQMDYGVGKPCVAVCGAIGIPIGVAVVDGPWPRNICPRCMGMWEGL